MSFNWSPQPDAREAVLDYGTGSACDHTRDCFRKWANALAGSDMKLAILCRDLEEAHANLMTYAKSVRNAP